MQNFKDFNHISTVSPVSKSRKIQPLQSFRITHMSDLLNLFCGSFQYFFNNNDVFGFVRKPGSNSIFQMTSDE